jgi:hypothetical protein
MIFSEIWGMVELWVWFICIPVVTICFIAYIAILSTIESITTEEWLDAKHNRMYGNDPYPNRKGPVHERYDPETDSWEAVGGQSWD